ncbi:MAG: hypothetical protein KF746_07450 [Chitinophagaceae bacterium]|nr:hypothetical protein [Chitinophagaceae bacterium]
MIKTFTRRFFLPSVIALFLLQACGGPDEDPKTKSEKENALEEEIVEQPDTVLFWTVDNTNKLKKRVYADSVKITSPESVINGINSIYPSIELEFVKKSGDTVYAHIDKAETLTSDMGSYGASEYISTVVLNLTTLDSIHFVNLDFREGSHATPGVFPKSDYENYKEKEQ